MQANNIIQSEQNVQNNRIPLLERQSQKVTTKLFNQLIKEFKLYYLAAISMNLLLSALFYVQYFRQCNGDNLNIWMIYAAIIFNLQLIFYILIILPSCNKNKTFQFAEQINQVVQVGEQEYYTLLDKQQRSKLRKRIENITKAHFKNYQKSYRYIDIVLTMCDLSLIILGFIYFSNNDYFKYMFSTRKLDTTSEECEFSAVWITFWTMILLCIIRKQAIQMCILILIGNLFDNKMFEFQMYFCMDYIFNRITLDFKRYQLIYSLVSYQIIFHHQFSSIVNFQKYNHIQYSKLPVKKVVLAELYNQQA